MSARRRLRNLPRKLGYAWAPRLASALRRRWALLRNAHADVRFLGPAYLGPGFSLHIPGDGTVIVGPGVEFRRGFRAEIGDGGRLVIGAASVFTYDVLIQCSTSVEIGERCMFGQATAIFDGNHRFRDLDRPMLAQGYDFRPIRIGDDATVTTKCTIVSDIGERAFVGANSVVAKPVPPFTVTTGAPAKPIDYLGPDGAEPAELAAARSEGTG